MPDRLSSKKKQPSLKFKPKWGDSAKAIGKLLIDVYFKNGQKIGADLVDLGASLGANIKNTPESLAWLLINNALGRAIVDILDEYCEEWQEITPETKIEFEKHLSSQIPLEGVEFEIDRDFFDKPQLLKVLPAAQEWMETWLKDLVASPADAKSMSVRLPSYFATALHDELLKNSEKYQDLTKQFADTLVSDAYKREIGWRRYRDWLDKQLDEPIFAETFGIRPLYVPLNGYYIEKQEIQRGNEREEHLEEIRHARDLEKAMDEWLQDAKSPQDVKSPCVRLISGGPGSGKSTFTKWWAARVAAKEEFKVWHIPLNHFYFTGDLEEKLKDFANNNPYIQGNPLKEDKILIIFDGLDELALSGNVGFAAAENFIEQLIALVNASQSNNWKVLISGRDAIIQSQINKFSKPEQIWHLLPYYLPKSEINNYRAEPKNLLAKDKRNDWWRKYGEVKGIKKYKGLPSNLKLDNLAEITTQPILNYLLAISKYFLENLIDKDTTRNEIYQSLLEQVYDRGWAKKNKATGDSKHPNVKELSLSDFQLILEEVGLCAWHGDGRKVTEGEIIGHCCNNSKKLNKLLSYFSEKLQNSDKTRITKLFTAFYFQEQGQRQQEKTFEFTHKSFGEFLTIKRLVRSIEEIDRKYRDDNDGWTEKQALKHWAEICKSGALDFDLLEFLRREIEIRHHDTPDLVAQWQQTICVLIGYLLRDGLPMEEFQGLTYHEMNRRAIQAEITLLATLNACALCTETVSTIEWENDLAFGNWLARIQGQRKADDFSIVAICLSWLNLEGAYLVGANLEGANLEHISWDEYTDWNNVENLEFAHNVPEKLKRQLGLPD